MQAWLRTGPRSWYTRGMGCLFCNIVEKKIPADVVYEDEHVIAFKDLRPVAPAHALVIPKKHIAAIHDLTAGDAEEIGRVAVRLLLEPNGSRGHSVVLPTHLVIRNSTGPAPG